MISFVVNYFLLAPLNTKRVNNSQFIVWYWCVVHLQWCSVDFPDIPISTSPSMKVAFLWNYGDVNRRVRLGQCFTCFIATPMDCRLCGRKRSQRAIAFPTKTWLIIIWNPLNLEYVCSGASKRQIRLCGGIIALKEFNPALKFIQIVWVRMGLWNK